MNETKPQHTPGPWLTNGVTQPGIIRIDAVNETRSGVEFLQNPIALVKDEANAERIVSCVNACAGIADPSVIKEIMKTAKGVVSEYENPMPDLMLRANYRKQLKAAIAKAEGK